MSSNAENLFKQILLDDVLKGTFFKSSQSQHFPGMNGEEGKGKDYQSKKFREKLIYSSLVEIHIYIEAQIC
jgi:hypothetical protein